LDLLIEQKAQGATQFKWLMVKALLKNEGIDKNVAQIRNYYNDMFKKSKLRNYL